MPVSAGGAGGGSTARATPDAAGDCSAAVAAADDGSEGAAAADPDAARNAASAALTPEATTAGARAVIHRICAHPYVRLPVLQEGVVPPHIQLSASNFAAGNGSSVHETLLAIRCLLMKEALGQIDAAFLVGYVQELAIASAARARGAKRMSRPVHGVANIGQQFLVLDAIVSALHILGISPPSCTWWEAFASCFDTNYRYDEPGARTQYSGRVNIDLANRLLAAMSIYKTGTRPDLEEVVDLKRILFFSSYSPSGFRTPRWDPWRSDHLSFEREYPMFSGLRMHTDALH
ncbi:hypothetical protein, conserved [Eimeria praecox]|uniref:Uncharacterized protein n=1 Tax=Eimeria praecox TaxID=51316 RepID=U6H5Z6_9EIME|nr:hypothetical protein, conserved [Eimeria praecox]